jgi:Predicted NTP pyrophosphohydrolase
MKISAGILPYIKEGDQILVLLGHMGGPIYKDIQDSYGIIKGEIDDINELPIKAAIREFKEETTELIDESRLIFIGESMQRSDKKNIIYGINEYFDTSNWTSNEFLLEWPKNSGNIHHYPEMDDYKWIKIEEAKRLIRKTQLEILEILEEKLKKESD